MICYAPPRGRVHVRTEPFGLRPVTHGDGTYGTRRIPRKVRPRSGRRAGARSLPRSSAAYRVIRRIGQCPRGRLCSMAPPSRRTARCPARMCSSTAARSCPSPPKTPARVNHAKRTASSCPGSSTCTTIPTTTCSRRGSRPSCTSTGQPGVAATSTTSWSSNHRRSSRRWNRAAGYPRAHSFATAKCAHWWAASPPSRAPMTRAPRRVRNPWCATSIGGSSVSTGPARSWTCPSAPGISRTSSGTRPIPRSMRSTCICVKENRVTPAATRSSRSSSTSVEPRARPSSSTAHR